MSSMHERDNPSNPSGGSPARPREAEAPTKTPARTIDLRMLRSAHGRTASGRGVRIRDVWVDDRSWTVQRVVLEARSPSNWTRAAVPPERIQLAEEFAGQERGRFEVTLDDDRLAENVDATSRPPVRLPADEDGVRHRAWPESRRMPMVAQGADEGHTRRVPQVHPVQISVQDLLGDEAVCEGGPLGVVRGVELTTEGIWGVRALILVRGHWWTFDRRRFRVPIERVSGVDVAADRVLVDG
jgi:hypothetical protein